MPPPVTAQVSLTDGLTKWQRYYAKNSGKIKERNKKSNAQRRAAKKAGKSAGNAKSTTAPPIDASETPATNTVEAAASAAPSFHWAGASPNPESMVTEGATTVPPIPLLPSSAFPKPSWVELDQLDDTVYLPPSYDGFTLARLHEITQISEGHTWPWDPAAVKVSEWERYRQLHVAVVRWSSVWGGVGAWSEMFEAIFCAACARGTEATKFWMTRVWGHAEVGKRLLDLLRVTNLPLPDEPESIVILWTKKSEDIVTLATGIAIIDTRYDILGRGLFGVSGEPDTDEEDDGYEDEDDDENRNDLGNADMDSDKEVGDEGVRSMGMNEEDDELAAI
ncbi:hypothetical protein FA13DRAFT_1787220 [Coprinellus micaceus]|uniref:Uncharacterized protein n=1 Tax=Coprinellus micaceus TaxID=71717 RepID=A0A4Y7TSE8_COPMI|nr:hypothetical protein FA13DRAFT_1787220 [Coprinellus micaceus]